jgi:hypothetical protein
VGDLQSRHTLTKNSSYEKKDNQQKHRPPGNLLSCRIRYRSPRCFRAWGIETADFMTAYMLALGKDLFGSVVITVFTSNLLDKVVTALLAWGIVKALPERTANRLSRVKSATT